MRRPIRCHHRNVLRRSCFTHRHFVCLAVVLAASAQTGDGIIQGTAAFGDWRADRPGTRRLIKPQDLPAPDLAQSARNFVRIVHRTDQQKPIVPNGFEVNLFASGLTGPRIVRTAPNGDVFVAESAAGRIRVIAAERQRGSATLGVRVRAALSVRHRLLSARPRSAMGLYRQHRLRRPLSLSQRRCDGARRRRDDRAAFAGRRSSHPRRRVLAGRQDHVCVGRIRLERAEGMGRLAGAALQNWPSDSSARRGMGRRSRARRRAGLRPARQERPRSSRPASAIASAWR